MALEDIEVGTEPLAEDDMELDMELDTELEGAALS